MFHRRNPTTRIIKNFDESVLPDDDTTAALDILFIPGDIFDSLRALNDEDVPPTDAWIHRTLRIAKKHDIVVIVLEGTPGHDWKQSRRFVDINENAGIGANLRYVDTLSIEYIEQYGITVLCVPDEWDTPENTLSQVHDLLRAKGLTQVDFAIMHGQFPHQLPEHVKAPKHDPEAYMAIVKYVILIGHVHTFSVYRSQINPHGSFIVAQGSFDRLTHGEEGPKGHVRLVVRSEGDIDLKFIENDNAMKFVTIRCTSMDLEETLQTISAVARELPDGSHIRVEADHDNPILTNMEELIRRFPLGVWSKLSREAAIEEKQMVTEDDTPFVPIVITRENLPNLLLERVARSGVSGDVMDAATDILLEVM
jgi:hypothetical protein